MRQFRIFRPLVSAFVLMIAGVLSQPAFAQDQNSAASKAEVQRGKELAFGESDGNCLACHQIKGGELVGNVGPQLANMKARFPDRELLFKRIWDETQFNPMTVMPPFGRNGILTEQKINKIVDFLYTL